MKTRHSVELEGFHDGESDSRAFIVRRTDLHVTEVTTIIDAVVEALENSSGNTISSIVACDGTDFTCGPA